MTEYEYRRLRADTKRAIRSFFDEAGFLEVETPSLSRELIPERHIDVFDVKDGYYLVPSPEVHLKPLIARMAQKAKFRGVYECAHAFRRNDENDTIYRQEFIMLEWYEMSADMARTTDVCAELIRHIARNASYTTKQTMPQWLKDDISTIVVTVEELFEKHTNISLESLVRRWMQQREYNAADRDLYEVEDEFHRIFVSDIEPHLPRESLCFVTHYPNFVPTLAKRYDERYAQRWELYADGIELANCYNEETERSRIDAFFACQHNAFGVRKKNVPYPASFLEHPPLPPCAGTALGVDRVISLLCGGAKWFGV